MFLNNSQFYAVKFEKREGEEAKKPYSSAEIRIYPALYCLCVEKNALRRLRARDRMLKYIISRTLTKPRDTAGRLDLVA